MASASVALRKHGSIEHEDGLEDEGSTTDDVDSSCQWTTDEPNAGESEGETSSRTSGTSNDDDDEGEGGSARRHKGGSLTPEQGQYCDMISYRPHAQGSRHVGTSRAHKIKANEMKLKGTTVLEAEDDEKKAQSDIETKNLLGDVDFDNEENLDLDQPESSYSGNNGMEYDASPLPALDPTLFALSEEQAHYYTGCFLHLMEQTQGISSLAGALNGTDPRMMDVVDSEFFRKSRLDNTSLSKIWALADVNEDGFLNHGEFTAAVHLIVLHLKARMPLPTQLPRGFRPPMTPVRQLVALPDGRYSSVVLASDGTASASSSHIDGNGHIVATGSDNTSRDSNNSYATQQLARWKGVNEGGRQFKPNHSSGFAPHQFRQECEADNMASSSHGGHFVLANDRSAFHPVPPASGATGTGKHHSLSDDHLHIYAASQREGTLAKFSNVPPLLVDSKPQAVNACFALPTLHSVTARGPPPPPPTRGYQCEESSKGHGRSASLDLKTFVSLSSYPRKSPHLWAAQTFPPLPVDQEVNLGAQRMALCDLADAFARRGGEDKETQTDQSVQLSSHNADELHIEGLPLQERCTVLRRLNEQLEGERVTLLQLPMVQVQLQLQLRLDEVQSKLATIGMRDSSGAVSSADSSSSTAQTLNRQPTTI